MIYFNLCKLGQMVTPVWEILYRILPGKQTPVRFFVVFLTPSMQMLGTYDGVGFGSLCGTTIE
jgi:hypothetical protein